MKFDEFAYINPPVSLARGKDFSFVEMAAVQPGIKFVYPREKRPFKSGGAKFHNGDTLFARITPCLENGKIAQVRGLEDGIGFGSTEFFVFRGREKVSHPDFVFYLSQTELIRGPAEKSMSGASGRQRADLSSIKEIEIPDIPFDKQQKISQILRAYDDLIENNNRRITIQEDLARSLYLEWFVKFRFPGHENCKFVESSLGSTPEGWVIMPSSRAIQVNPRTKMAKEGDKPFASMFALSGTTMVIDGVVMKTGNSGAKFINTDTLFSRITPCLQNGKIGFVKFLTQDQVVGFGSTEFIVLRASEFCSAEFIYLLARSDTFRQNAINSMSGASGRQRVHNACFDSYELAVPDSATMAKFTNAVRPIFNSCYNLSSRNENLKKQRDLLLPKLISGQIDLSPALSIENKGAA